jgi:HlyD family secretion protein
MQPKWNFCGVLLLSLLCIVSCSRESSREAQGYIEGRYTYMATPVSGVLKKLFVERGANVRKGDMLAALEEQPESDLYDAALENLNQSLSARDAIAANLQYAKITYERYKILVPKGAIQQSQLDNAKSIYQSTVAQLAQANASVTSTAAALAQSKWVKAQKILNAPIDGVVFDTYYRPGEYTIANQPILSLLAPADIKAIFYVNAPELSQMKLGKEISIHCDACTETYTGKISFISPSAEYTPPVIYSNQTNEKLIFRIEAEFAKETAVHLHPGQPVSVTWQISHDE